MHMTYRELVLNIIKKSLNRKFLLDEFQNIVNSSVPSPKRMSKKKLSHIVYLLDKEGHCNWNRINKDGFIFYEFDDGTGRCSKDIEEGQEAIEC